MQGRATPRGATLGFPMYVTANYRAPELWDASVVDLGKCLRPAVDLWSFGCVLYEIAVGKVLMRPIRGNSSQSCHATIQEWCQQWQSLQKTLQGMGRPSLQNAQGSRNSENVLACRLLLLDPSLKPAIKAALNPNPALRSWGRQ